MSIVLRAIGGILSRIATNAKGFTIIELMIGLVIVSILSGLMSLIYQEYREKSYRSVAIAQASDIKKSILATISDSVNSSLFDEDRVLRVSLNGTVSCSTGCGGIDLNEMFPGFTHDVGSDLRVFIYQNGTYDIYSGHCKALNSSATQYMGWILTNDDPIEPHEFDVEADITDCYNLMIR